MKENFKKHFWYYFTFICLEVSGIGAVLFFAADKYLQMIAVFLMVFFYIAWSIFHHYVHHKLTLKIFLEYVLMGALGEVVIFFLLQ